MYTYIQTYIHTYIRISIHIYIYIYIYNTQTCALPKEKDEQLAKAKKRHEKDYTYYAIIWCNVLIILYYNIVYFTILYCTMLCYTILFYTTIYYILYIIHDILYTIYYILHYHITWHTIRTRRRSRRSRRSTMTRWRGRRAFSSRSSGGLKGDLNQTWNVSGFRGGGKTKPEHFRVRFQEV